MGKPKHAYHRATANLRNTFQSDVAGFARIRAIRRPEVWRLQLRNKVSYSGRSTQKRMLLFMGLPIGHIRDSVERGVTTRFVCTHELAESSYQHQRRTVGPPRSTSVKGFKSDSRFFDAADLSPFLSLQMEKAQLMSCFTTRPPTSVTRKSRPWCE